MKYRWVVASLALLLTQVWRPLHAFEPFVVKAIRLEGLHRISEGTVYNYLPIQVGEELAPFRSQEILKILFETGFFQDIQLLQEGSTLIVKMLERPTIGKITVSGNKIIPEEKLLSTLKSIGLSEGHVFDRAVLEQTRNEIERVYFSRGHYSVQVESVVVDQEPHRVNVSIQVNEGQSAHIRGIHFVGNEQFSDQQLLKSFQLAPTYFLSWASQSDQYDKQKLTADLETLRNFYFNKGYLDFKILSTQVAITPDKQDIYITVNIEEGAPFALSGYQLAGDCILPLEEMKALINLPIGECFSREKVVAAVKQMSECLGERGYAYAIVNPVPDLDRENNTVSLTFYVDPGKLVTVRRIVLEGNTKTQDAAIRRELIQMEGAPANTQYIEESRKRLSRTGYFKDVSVDMQQVIGSSDLVDVIYRVEEASVAQIGGGLGYSDVDRWVLEAEASNRNFLGTGNAADLKVSYSKPRFNFHMAYNNPYYCLNGLSRGFSVFYNRTDLSKSTKVSDYKTDSYGGNVTYGWPLSLHDRITFAYGYQSSQFDLKENTLEIKDFIREYGVRSKEFTLAGAWVQNSFDKMVFPNEGLQHSLNILVSVPGSHLQYYRLTYSAQGYLDLGKGFVLASNTFIGYGSGYGKTKKYPFYRNFFAGGASTVRGFKESSLGPIDSAEHPYGGNFLVSGTIALVVPVTRWFDWDSSRFRVTWFVDGGQVYGLGHNRTQPYLGSHSGVRYSTGLSLTWISPLGPIGVSLAVPLNAYKGYRYPGREGLIRKDDRELISLNFGFGL